MVKRIHVKKSENKCRKKIVTRRRSTHFQRHDDVIIHARLVITILELLLKSDDRVTTRGHIYTRAVVEQYIIIHRTAFFDGDGNVILPMASIDMQSVGDENNSNSPFCERLYGSSNVCPRFEFVVEIGLR